MQNFYDTQMWMQPYEGSNENFYLVMQMLSMKMQIMYVMQGFANPLNKCSFVSKTKLFEDSRPKFLPQTLNVAFLPKNHQVLF